MQKNDFELLDRISIDSSICHGKPSVRNTRHTVESILEFLAAGDTTEDILSEFDDLDIDDILACIAFAGYMIKNKTVFATA